MPSSCSLPQVWSTLWTPDQSSTLLDNVPHISTLLSYFVHHDHLNQPFAGIFQFSIIWSSNIEAKLQIDARVDSRGLFKCTIWICVMSIVIGFPQTFTNNLTNHKSGIIDKREKRAMHGCIFSCLNHVNHCNHFRCSHGKDCQMIWIEINGNNTLLKIFYEIPWGSGNVPAVGSSRNISCKIRETPGNSGRVGNIAV